MKAHIIEKLKEFKEVVISPGSRDDPSGSGIGTDVSVAIDEIETFRERSFVRESDHLLYELEWRGKGSTISDLVRDFFNFYGYFACTTQFIEKSIEEQHIIFIVALGSTGDNCYAHTLVFRIVGARVKWILSDEPCFPGYDSD